MAAEIKRCTCKHAGQDKLHGDGMRVWNQHQKGHRCSVCGASTGK